MLASRACSSLTSPDIYLEGELIPQGFQLGTLYYRELLVIHQIHLQFLNHLVAELWGGGLKVHYRDTHSRGQFRLNIPGNLGYGLVKGLSPCRGGSSGTA
jgi:hypothetical protein